MSTAQQIGTVASSTDKLLVQRLGEQLSLRQGDAILAGDVMQNTDTVAVDIELKAQAAGQADSLVTLAPNSAAQVNTVAAADGAAGGMIEVTSLTEGVELYAVGDGANGAVLAASTESFSGLVGAGLLAGGSFASAGTVAAVVGGGAGLAAIATSDNDDTPVLATGTDTRVDNEDDTDSPDDEPIDEGGDDMATDDPDPNTPPPTEEAASPLAPLTDALEGTPLAPLGDVLGMVTDALPLGSLPIPTSPDALPIPIPGA